MNNSEYILDHFKFEHKSKANDAAVILGEKYRFSLLTNRLFRLEYSEKGQFEDRPSQTFWFRDQTVPVFTLKENNDTLEIKTEYLVLTYQKGQSFSTLKIKLINSKETWVYGTEEKDNLLGTYRTLDRTNGSVDLEKGLLSRKGYVIIDDSKSLIFNVDYWLEKRLENNIDLYFFGYGNDYKSCISDYYRVSGQTPLLPRFALGNWWSKYWNYTDEELKELINNFKRRSIPLSVCILDMDWHETEIPTQYGSGWTGYTWNKQNYPTPEAFLAWLKSNKIYSALNLHPALGVRGHEDCYKSVAEFMGVDVTSEETVAFDCPDPKFMNAYFNLVHHPLEEMGVDFWWMDWQQGNKTSIEGLDPLWLLNHLSSLDMKRNNKKRSFIFSRWPGLGGHRYPIGFSGDTHVTWESLKFQTYFTPTAANVGFGWWSHDIGGFYKGIIDPQLYTRWVQFGVFSPILRLHSTKHIYHKREPWRWDAEVERIATKYLRFRHQLIPYIYTMSRRNEDFGMPIVTPMYYEHPNSANAYKFNEQYYYGSELIVAPFVTPTIEKLNKSLKNVWLPEGIWFDFFNGELYKGNRVHPIYGSLDEIPVFAKAGAIIPLALLTKENQYDNPDVLEVHIFPCATNQFKLYEDDGISLNYKNGHYVETVFDLKCNDNIMDLSISSSGDLNIIPENRKFIIKFRTVVENVKFESNQIYEHSYDKELKTHSILLNPLNNDRITIKLIGETSEIVDDSYDYKYKITELLDFSTYEMKIKESIGFAYPYYNKLTRGTLKNDNTPKERAMDLLLTDYDENLKKALLTILLKAKD